MALSMNELPLVTHLFYVDNVLSFTGCGINNQQEGCVKKQKMTA